MFQLAWVSRLRNQPVGPYFNAYGGRGRPPHLTLDQGMDANLDQGMDANLDQGTDADLDQGMEPIWTKVWSRSGLGYGADLDHGMDANLDEGMDANLEPGMDIKTM